TAVRTRGTGGRGVRRLYTCGRDARRRPGRAGRGAARLCGAVTPPAAARGSVRRGEEDPRSRQRPAKHRPRGDGGAGGASRTSPARPAVGADVRAAFDEAAADGRAQGGRRASAGETRTEDR